MDAAETVVARRRLCLIASLVALVMCSGGALAGSEPVPPAATEVAAPVGHGNFLNLEARAAYNRTVVLQELALTDLVAELGADHPNVAVRLNDLAGIHHGWGERGRADLIYRQALRIAEKAFDPGHPSVTTILLNYSLLLTDLGRSVEARELKKRADEWHTVEVSGDGLEVPISYH